MRAWISSIGILYLVLAIAVTWPLARELDHALPVGSNKSATVPLVSAWALWWTADRAQEGFSNYWDAPIFHPVKDAFAFSEPMPLLGLLATPAFALGASSALAYNLVLLLTLWLNGMVGYALCRELRLLRFASAFGGALLLLLPYVIHQLGVLTLVPLFGMEAALLFAVRAAFRPSLRSGAALGLSCAASFALCMQHTMMFVLALALAAPFLLTRRLLAWPLARAVGVAVAVAFAASAPLAFAHHRALAGQHFERTVHRGEQGSAGVYTWLRTPHRDALPVPGIKVSSPPWRRALFPGSARVLLAIGGALVGFAASRRRRTRFLVALIALSVVLSVLGNLKLGSLSVYELVRDAVPGVSAMRSVWRAGVVAQIAVMLLAAQGLQALWCAYLRSRFWARSVALLSMAHRARARVALAAAVAVFAVFELWPPPRRLYDVPLEHDYRGLAAAVTAHVPKGSALLVLPVSRDHSEAAAELAARFMYATVFLQRPLVGGYSSYLPKAYRSLRTKLADEGDQPRAKTLRSAHAGAVLVARSKAQAMQVPAPYRRVFVDDVLQIDLWTDAPENAQLRQGVAAQPADRDARASFE